MKVSSIPPPGNGGFALGDPFDARAALLLAHDDARRSLRRRQVEGDRAAVLEAELTATETAADLLAHEQHLAAAFTMMFRFAVRHFPASVSDLLSQVPAVVELADAVAALESGEVRA